MHVVRPLAWLALGLPLIFLVALPVIAEEEQDVAPAEALLGEIVVLRKADDYNALVEVLLKVPEIYVASEDDPLRGKIRSALGKIARDRHGGDARLAAIQALVDIEDPKAAWKELSKLMPKGKEREASPVDMAVVKAAGNLAQSKSIKGLEDLAMKAKDPLLAATAAESLGGFGDNKRNRVKILEELIKIGQRTRPGRSTEKATSTVALERWAKVERGVVRGLNELTGRGLGSFEEWEVLWKDNKKRPAILFLEDDT